jgi:transcriptional regulator with XRE-family HTH domain
VGDRQGPLYWYWSANQVVAYNLARAREAKGWSQEEAGRRLEPHLGVAWSKATFSQAERSIDPGKSRAFTANELAAFADTFGLPVVWFLLPPPPGTAGTPTRSETGQTPTEYATDVRRLLTRIAGTAEHRDAIRERLQEFANELTVRALDEAVDLFVRGASELGINEPTLANELRRWRRSLETAAEGLGAMEDAIAKRAGRGVEEDLELPDLRTIELPRHDAPRRQKARGRDVSPDLGS